MPWLGVRCWKDKIALALVEDDPAGPRLVQQSRARAPELSDAGDIAWWFAHASRASPSTRGSPTASPCV